MSEKLFSKQNTKMSFFYVFGNIFNKAISVLILPIITRLLSTSDYGIVNTYLSLVAIFSVFCGLSTGQTLRSAKTDFADDYDGYISSMYGLSFVSLIASTIIALTVGWFVVRQYFILVVLGVCQGYMSYVIETSVTKHMMDSDYKKRTLLLILPNLITAIASIVVLFLMTERNYYGRIIPYVIVYLIFGIILLAKSIHKGKKLYKKEYWKYGINLALPLMLHGLSCNILSNVDRAMITAMCSPSDTGIYSIAYNVGLLLLVFTSAIESVWIPWFTKKMYSNEKTEINKAAFLYVCFGAVITSLALLGLPEILKLLSDEDYWSGIYYLMPIICASFMMFLYSISVDLEYYKKSTKSIAVNTCIAAIVNLALNFIFIPKFGAIAAAYTTLASYSVSFIIHYFFARHLDKELFSFKLYIIPIVIVFTFAILSFVFINNWIIRWILLVVIFIVLLIVGILFLKKRKKKI